MKNHITASVEPQVEQSMSDCKALLRGDVPSVDITFTKIHFPVKAKLKLSTSIAEVTADRPAFEVGLSQVKFS